MSLPIRRLKSSHRLTEMLLMPLGPVPSRRNPHKLYNSSLSGLFGGVIGLRARLFYLRHENTSNGIKREDVIEKARRPKVGRTVTKTRYFRRKP